MADTRILRITSTASGKLLLDGLSCTLAELERVIKQNEESKLIVWYHRENEADAMDGVIDEVIKLITEHRLVIRLSSRPDFSDILSDVEASLDRVFASVREKAALNQLVIMRPDGRFISLPGIQKAPPQALEAVERMLPSNVKRKVAVIADTDWSVNGPVDLASANQAIPFFGLLIGFSSLGHGVWIFNPKAISILKAGCRDADVLIIDGARCPALPGDWQSAARSTMSGSQILVHDRETYRLRKALDSDRRET